MGGAFALAAHGHARFTNDLDLMVLTDDLSRVHRALQGDRFSMVNEVIFRDARTGLTVDIFPVEDEAQRDVLEQAERITLHEAKRIRVIRAEGLALMLLREATSRDQEHRSERLRDIEVLARKNELDWAYLRRWVKQMGYADAYRELRIEEKPTL